MSRRDLSYTLAEAPQPVDVPFRLLGECSGGQKVLQRAILLMLVGTADKARFAGGNLGAIMTGANVPGADGMRGRMLIAISDVKAIIKADQANLDIGDGERLEDIELVDLEFPARDHVSAVLNVITAAGETLLATLTL